MLVYSKDIYAVAIFAVVYRYSSNYKANKKETTTTTREQKPLLDKNF